MKWRNVNLIVLILYATCFLKACGPILKTTLVPGIQPSILEKDAEVYVYASSDRLPVNLSKIGNTSIVADDYKQKCDLRTLLEQVKREARRLGANVVHITQLDVPSHKNFCHRLQTTLYTGAKDSISKQYKILKFNSNVARDKQYALLHIYRFDGASSWLRYNLKLGDTTLCRVKNNFKTTLKLNKEGSNLITINNRKRGLPIDIVFGKEYYLRCSVNDNSSIGIGVNTMGITISTNPSIDFISNDIGALEFEAFNAKRDETKSTN